MERISFRDIKITKNRLCIKNEPLNISYFNYVIL